MVKKSVTIRLTEETLRKIDDRGNRSDVIRNMIEYALKPKNPPKIIEPKVKIVLKEIPVDIVKYINVHTFDWTKFNKKIEREILRDDIKKGMPKWYLDSRIKDFERKYGELFQ